MSRWLILLFLLVLPQMATALDQGEAAAEALKEIQDRCANSAPSVSPMISPDSIKWVVGPTSVNVSGQCFFNDGRYQGWHSATRAFDAKCDARPEELGWEGGSTAASVNVCHRGCMYTSALDPLGTAGFSYLPTGGVCSESDAPEPKPAGDGGGDDGGGTGGETGGGDGDGGGDGGGNGDGGGDGGGNGEGGGNGDGDGGGNSDGGGDGDGDGDGDGENPSLPENPTYPGDVPMPYADPPIPSSYLGQWSSGLGGGSCPAAKVVTIGVGPVSTSVSFEFKPLCDFAQMIRGLVIACAALAAAYIVSGVRK
ncbi:TPA: virulence factor TspB C-terminal domain-related protein [Stenotrophomonas maltophilia]